jgi:hypothetical protein
MRDERIEVAGDDLALALRLLSEGLYHGRTSLRHDRRT